MTNLKEIKNNIFKKENFYLLIIILATFFLDRYSKLYILKNFSDSTHYLNDFINLDLVWNTGIGFGLLSFDSSIIYNSISIIIGLIIMFLVYYISKSNQADKIIFSVIIGGALGNFYDRVFINAVPDFIDLHYGNFHWFTFNVADIFITIGIIAFLLRDFFIKTNNEKN